MSLARKIASSAQYPSFDYQTKRRLLYSKPLPYGIEVASSGTCTPEARNTGMVVDEEPDARVRAASLLRTTMHQSIVLRHALWTYQRPYLGSMK